MMRLRLEAPGYRTRQQRHRVVECHTQTRPPAPAARAGVSARAKLCCCCAQRKEATAVGTVLAAGRRVVLFQTLSLTLAWSAAFAEELQPSTSSTPAEDVASTSSSEPVAQSLLADKKYEEVDFELQYPRNFKIINITQKLADFGPQPPPSPVKARIESPDSNSLLSVIVTPSPKIKPTFFQLVDISQYGSAEETAQYVLPRGFALAATQVLKVEVPSKVTPFGQVIDAPPKTYYWYEFFNSSARGVMSVAAQRGKVYVCGGLAPLAAWPELKPALEASTRSFRLRDAVSML